LLLCEVCRPSCIETFSSAKRRAASIRDNLRARAVSRATWFHSPQWIVRLVTLANNRASWVCSAVRVVLVADPSACTWFSASAYSWLVSVGGPAGWYWVGVSSANGSVVWNCRNCGAPRAGGVGWYRPGNAGSE
jgi:hypothetical protein